MSPEQLRDDVLRAEGYAKGFLDGYVSLANRISADLAKENKPDTPTSENIEEIMKNGLHK